MQYRLDKYGNKLSILGFGCMRFPRARGRIDMDKSEAMVLDAVNRGVNYFDTAYLYPGSEEAVGEILAKNNLREKIRLATKLPLFMCKACSDFDKFFNISLKRLKTNCIDYYLMHMITTPEQWKGLCDMGIEKWIDEKKAQGRIKQLGFSFHGKRDDFVKIVDARNWDFTQIQYNYLDINNQAGRTGLLHAASKKIPVIVMEPLLGGRLADPRKIPPKILDIMKEAAAAKTPAALALRWIWNHPGVTLLLSGMSAQSQLDENIYLADDMPTPGTLAESELKTVSKVIAAYSESDKVKCTGCGYCVPCPFGVNIPDCFASYNASYTLSKLAALRGYVMATAALTTKKSLAGSCTQCGKCEEHCPQSIPIRESLKEVRRRLEPFWFSAGISIVRFFTGVKAKKGR